MVLYLSDKELLQLGIDVRFMARIFTGEGLWEATSPFSVVSDSPIDRLRRRLPQVMLTLGPDTYSQKQWVLSGADANIGNWLKKELERMNGR